MPLSLRQSPTARRRVLRSLAALASLAGLACAAGTPATPRPTPAAALRQEVEALNAAMVAAFKQDPSSVARFYTDDARIIGGGTFLSGRQEVDRYWAQASGFRDWSLEVLDVGGEPAAPWLLGRSTLTGQGGRTMVTTFVGVLKRAADGTLRYHIDMYTSAAAPRPVRTP